MTHCSFGRTAGTGMHIGRGRRGLNPMNSLDKCRKGCCGDNCMTERSQNDAMGRVTISGRLWHPMDVLCGREWRRSARERRVWE